MLSRLTALLLALSLTGGAASAADPIDQSTIDQVRRFRQRTVAEYGSSRAALEKDLDAFRQTAEKLGMFESTPEFHEWWKKTKLTNKQIKALDKITVAETGAMLYFKYAADRAKKAGGKGKGNEVFLDTVEKSQSNPLWRWALGGAGVVLAGYVIPRIIDIIFHGPISQMMNSALEPFVRPIRERIEQISNTHLAPRLVGWAQFVSGENQRRKAAIEQAKKGEELSGGSLRFESPAIAVEDFAEDHRVFYHEFMKADYRWRGWMAPEYIRARNTGFELLYSQWTSLAERISTYETNANTLRLVLSSEVRPELIAGGATKAEIDQFADVLERKQDIMVFENIRDPRIAGLDDELTKIIQAWQKKGIPTAKIDDFYELSVTLFVSKNRPAFALAAMLDNERYFQENNLALKGLNKIQAWQEQAREMVGYYDLLRKYGPRIQRFYDRKGLKYNVEARIAERGYPLGGDPRPEGLRPIKYCRDLLKGK